jgi:hypothetical protein
MITYTNEYSFLAILRKSSWNHDGTPNQERKKESRFCPNAEEASSKVHCNSQDSPGCHVPLDCFLLNSGRMLIVQAASLTSSKRQKGKRFKEIKHCQ